MKTREEQRWERMRQMLAADARGDAPKPLVSTRTLFGIPSCVDVAVEKIVAEDEAHRRAERKTAESDA